MKVYPGQNRGWWPKNHVKTREKGVESVPKWSEKGVRRGRSQGKAGERGSWMLGPMTGGKGICGDRGIERRHTRGFLGDLRGLNLEDLGKRPGLIGEEGVKARPKPGSKRGSVGFKY